MSQGRLVKAPRTPAGRSRTTPGSNSSFTQSLIPSAVRKSSSSSSTNPPTNASNAAGNAGSGSGNTFRSTIRNFFGPGKTQPSPTGSTSASSSLPSPSASATAVPVPVSATAVDSPSASHPDLPNSRSQLPRPSTNSARNGETPLEVSSTRVNAQNQLFRPAVHRNSIQSRADANVSASGNNGYMNGGAGELVVEIIGPSDLSTITELDTSGVSLSKHIPDLDDSTDCSSILGSHLEDADPTTTARLPPLPSPTASAPALKSHHSSQQLSPIPPSSSRSRSHSRERTPETPSFDLSASQIEEEVRQALQDAHKNSNDQIVSEWLGDDEEAILNPPTPPEQGGRGVNGRPSFTFEPLSDTITPAHPAAGDSDELGFLLAPPPSSKSRSVSSIPQSTPSRKNLDSARAKLGLGLSSFLPKPRSTSGSSSTSLHHPRRPSTSQINIPSSASLSSPNHAALQTNRRMSSDSYLRPRPTPQEQYSLPPSPLGDTGSSPSTWKEESRVMGPFSASTSRITSIRTPSRADSYSSASTSAHKRAGLAHRLARDSTSPPPSSFSPSVDTISLSRTLTATAAPDITERSRTFLNRTRKRSMSVDHRSPSLFASASSSSAAAHWEELSRASSLSKSQARPGSARGAGQTRPTMEWLGPRTAKAFAAAGLIEPNTSRSPTVPPASGGRYATLSSASARSKLGGSIAGSVEGDISPSRASFSGAAESPPAVPSSWDRGRVTNSNLGTPTTNAGYFNHTPVPHPPRHVFSHSLSRSYSQSRMSASASAATFSQRSDSRLSSGPPRTTISTRSSASAVSASPSQSHPSPSLTSLSLSIQSQSQSQSPSPLPQSQSQNQSPVHQYQVSELQLLKEKHAAEMEALLNALSDSQRLCKMLREENRELRERIVILEERGGGGVDAMVASRGGSFDDGSERGVGDGWGMSAARSDRTMMPPPPVSPRSIQPQSSFSSAQGKMRNGDISARDPRIRARERHSNSVSSSRDTSLDRGRYARLEPQHSGPPYDRDSYRESNHTWSSPIPPASAFRAPRRSSSSNGDASQRDMTTADSRRQVNNLRKRTSGTSTVFHVPDAGMSMLVQEGFDDEDSSSRIAGEGDDSILDAVPSRYSHLQYKHRQHSSPSVGSHSHQAQSHLRGGANSSITSTTTGGGSPTTTAMGSPKSLYLRPEHDRHLEELDMMDGFSIDMDMDDEGEDDGGHEGVYDDDGEG